MRGVSQTTLDLLTQPKEVGVRATFRKTLPVFAQYSMTDSLNLTDPVWIDACNYFAGILRVTSVGNVLYTQFVSDIHGTWPAWVNTGIALYTGSRPAVDDGYVYYQVTNGTVYYRHWSNWASVVTVRNMPGAIALAPIGNKCWGLWQRNAGAYEIVSLNNTESSQYTIYGPTSMPRVDAVLFNDKEYFYTMDRDAGRIIEIQHVGNSVAGMDSYGVGKPIIPIDAIDDVYGLKLGYASVIDNKVVVTGRLTRTSDDAAVSCDVYLAGPEHFSFGREMFIQGDSAVYGKMLRVGNEFVVSGALYYWIAKATTVFGGTGHPDLELTTSDLASFNLAEAEGRSTNLEIDLSTDLAHTALGVGSDIVIEMAYNNNWTKLTTCSLDADQRNYNTDGQARLVSGVGKSAKRLAQWSPDQGVYIPSQAKMYDNPGNLTKVVRASGLWERDVPSDVTSPIKLKELNKLGVLYSTARASRGGQMYGKFYYPSDTNLKPYYGVAVNFYRETAAEAAARLNKEVSDLDETDYGCNGIAAIYGATEHNSGPGISLNLWQNNSMTKLTSVSITIPANTWHWLLIDFVEGEIHVKYRLDSSTGWVEEIACQYANATSPWKSDGLGRGAILVKNIMPTYQMIGGIGPEDTTIAVADNSIWPSSGTILLDAEQISFSGKSNNRSIANSSTVDYWPRFKFNAAFGTGQGLAFPKQTMADNYWAGCAIATVSGVGFGRTLRCVASDDYGINTWNPNDFVTGWSAFIGNTAYGSFVSDNYNGALYADEDIKSVYWHGGEMSTGPWSTIAVRPAIYITARGANSTAATSHIPANEFQNLTATLYTAKSVLCGAAGSFSQDEDLSIEDALKTVVGISGGQVRCKALADGAHVFSTADVFNVASDRRNFIATFDLPTGFSTGVGIAFRGQVDFTYYNGYPNVATGDAYYLEVYKSGATYSIGLYHIANHLCYSIETVPIRPTNLNGAGTANVPTGTVKVSVEDNYISVWLNGRFLHTFYNESYPTGGHVAFWAQQACTMNIHLSELHALLADVVVGTRGNGMSVISELLADRRIYWRDEPDGSMYFYKTREWVGSIPDIVSSVQTSQTDAIISRVRSEGLNISEILDSDLVSEYGNVFVTVNARYANNVAEAQAVAKETIEEAWRQSQIRQYSVVPHPGLQPGDAAIFTEMPGVASQVIVRGQSMVVGYSGTNFVCNMQLDVMPYERVTRTTIKVDDQEPGIVYTGAVEKMTMAYVPYQQYYYQTTYTVIYDAAIYNNPRQKACFTFTGTRVQVGLHRDEDNGVAEIWIDGQPPFLVDCHDDTGTIQEALSWISDELERGSHTVEVFCDGGMIYLDYFQYWT